MTISERNANALTYSRKCARRRERKHRQRVRLFSVLAKSAATISAGVTAIALLSATIYGGTENEQ